MLVIIGDDHIVFLQKGAKYRTHPNNGLLLAWYSDALKGSQML